MPRSWILGVVGLVVLWAAAPADAQRRKGTVTIEGAETGADVFVDGDHVGQVPIDPIPLVPGAHTIRVAKPGFTEYTEVVRVRGGRSNTVNVDMMAVSMLLTIRSVPEGAQVFVDGAFSGQAPIELELVEGKHSVLLKHPYHRDAIRTVDAFAGVHQSLDIQLEEVPLEERLANQPVEADAWYQQPMTWVAVAGGALVVAAGVVLVVVLTSEDPSQVDEFCGEGCIKL
ncbi:MAG: PEGA domain-containing protein [Myxococcales bacterium]|nr:PEGA domain-containing protein [Myxococcales bacterium]